MEFIDVIKNRHSIRKFKSDPIPKDDLQRIIEAGTYAPSINNSQPWKFICITNKTVLEKLSTIVGDKIQNSLSGNPDHDKVINSVKSFSTFFKEAPAVIIILSKPYEAVIDRILEEKDFSAADVNKIRNHPNIQTMGAAVENILLSAVDNGYGACWLTGPLFAREEMEKELAIESPFKIDALVAVGKTDEDKKAKSHSDLREVLKFVE